MAFTNVIKILFFLVFISANLKLEGKPIEGKSEPVTAHQVWKSLQIGNKKFVDNPKYAKQRIRLAKGQNPPCVVLGCSDSRVPPEKIFSQNIGKLFVVRVAGEVVDAVDIDSIEYTVSHHDTPLIVVLGHTQCGAVSGALNRLRLNHGVIDKQPQQGHLNAVLIPIETAIIASGINIYAPDALEKAIRANIAYQANQLIIQSQLIATEIAEKKLTIIGAEYDLATGVVEQLFSIP